MRNGATGSARARTRRNGEESGRELILAAARERLESVLARPDLAIHEAVRRLDAAGTGALLLRSENGNCAGLLTDGDVRRAFLKGVPFQNPCGSIATRSPLVARLCQTTPEWRRLMNRNDVNHLPLIDDSGCAVGLLLRRDLMDDETAGLSAVIMAGGFGTRLMPLTDTTPKPMLPVGDRPLMELTVESLRRAGIRNVNITTHHLGERISAHFRDGSDFGVQLTYVSEEHPMGTAGGLSLMGEPSGPLLVINGDVLTSVDFRKLLRFHQEHLADLTLAVRRYETEIPYGVIDGDGPYVRGLREKPTLQFLVNAGIYILEPRVFDLIPAGTRFDMTDLVQRLLELGRRVASFPIMEYWLDIGQHKDYAKAVEDAKAGRLSA
jgi:dTDP-glucose pyrophosphorylase